MLSPRLLRLASLPVRSTGLTTWYVSLHLVFNLCMFVVSHYMGHYIVIYRAVLIESKQRMMEIVRHGILTT